MKTIKDFCRRHDMSIFEFVVLSLIVIYFAVHLIIFLVGMIF